VVIIRVPPGAVSALRWRGQGASRSFDTVDHGRFPAPFRLTGTPGSRNRSS